MGFVDKWPSSMQGQWVFRGWMGGQHFLDEQLPMPASTSPEKFVGEFTNPLVEPRNPNMDPVGNL